MTYPILEAYGYRYLDAGPATDLPPVVLLHGLLGGVSNWMPTVDMLAAHHYRVLAPVIPVDSLPLSQTNMQGVVEYTRGFTERMGLNTMVLAGNSMGGQVALLYALNYPEAVEALILSGSSGIYEIVTGTTTFRRQDPDFIRERAALTFYDPVHVTDELVEKSLELANDRNRALRIIKLARSSQRESLNDRLGQIEVPTQLIWGRDDRITPPDVAVAFQRYLPNANLHFIDRCGHAPMMERPTAFNQLMLAFLREVIGTALLAPSGDTP